MTIGDIVFLSNSGVTSPGQNEPPVLGVVNSEADPEITVLWQTGELSTVLEDSVRKVIPSAVDVFHGIVGKYVQITGYPRFEEDLTNKSPAASGIVVEALAHASFADSDPSQGDILVATENGKHLLLLPDVFVFSSGEFRTDAPFRVDEGRREV